MVILTSYLYRNLGGSERVHGKYVSSRHAKSMDPLLLWR